MPTAITVKAIDQSTYKIMASFTDEEELAFTPKTLTWSLYDRDGTLVNSRENVAVSPLATSIKIVLSGDDLKRSEGVMRWVVLRGTYDSTNGDDLALVDAAKFDIEDVIGV